MPAVLANGYQEGLVITIMAYGIALVGLDLLFGEVGLLSFGQGAFLAIGGYGTAIVMTDLRLPFLAAVVMAGLASAVVAVVLATPATQLASFSFGLVTFGFAFVMDTVLNGSILVKVTGGNVGKVAPPGEIFGLSLRSGESLFYFTLIALLVASMLLRTLVYSRTGRALRTIKENELVATSIGIPIKLYKITTFSLAAVLASVAGAIIGQSTGFLAPGLFDSNHGFLLVAMLILGGVGRPLGPIVGAAFFVVLPELMQSFPQAAPAIFALLFLGALILAPQGLMGLVADVIRLTFQRLRRQPTNLLSPRAPDSPAPDQDVVAVAGSDK